MHHLNKSIIMIILNFKQQTKTIKQIHTHTHKLGITEGGGIRTRASLYLSHLLLNAPTNWANQSDARSHLIFLLSTYLYLNAQWDSHVD